MNISLITVSVLHDAYVTSLIQEKNNLENMIEKVKFELKAYPYIDHMISSKNFLEHKLCALEAYLQIMEDQINIEST